MKKMRTDILIIASIVMSTLMIFVYHASIDLNEYGSDGLLNIADSHGKEIIPLHGEYLAADGILTPERMAEAVTLFRKTGEGLQKLSFNEIRKYHAPGGSVTVYIKVRGHTSGMDGMLIEEIYSAANVYVNGSLIASLGRISDHKPDVLMKKESRLVRYEKADELDVVIQISNPEHIGGQLQKHLFIGPYEKLFRLWNMRIVLKSIHSVFYFTMSLVFVGLFCRNKKHQYLLTLALTGLLNGYIILTYFEPFVIFTPQGAGYLVNSYFQTVPTLFTQYLSVLTILFFIKTGFVYKHRHQIVPVSLAFLTLGIVYVTLAEQAADILYIGLLFAVILFMVYALFLLAKMYAAGNRRMGILYMAFLMYAASYALLTGISLSPYIFQVLSRYQILLMTGQFAFYVVISYFIITDFSRSFYITEVNESYLEAVVQEKTGQLEDSLKLLEKEDAYRRQFLSDVSHDLRSPLTVMNGYLELIHTGKIEKSRQDHYISIMLQKISYMGELLENILFLARIEHGGSMTRDSEDLCMIINEVTEGYEAQPIDIQCNMKDPMQFVCDYGQMKRLFVNLIDNAIEHSLDGSTVFIDGVVEHAEYVIRVRDEGVGIEEKHLDRIFNRFARLDTGRGSDSQHFGLGLAIVQSIVNNHAGRIQCESTIGEGTMFTLRFPVGEEVT